MGSAEISVVKLLIVIGQRSSQHHLGAYGNVCDLVVIAVIAALVGFPSAAARRGAPVCVAVLGVNNTVGRSDRHNVGVGKIGKAVVGTVTQIAVFGVKVYKVHKRGVGTAAGGVAVNVKR